MRPDNAGEEVGLRMNAFSSGLGVENPFEPSGLPKQILELLHRMKADLRKDACKLLGAVSRRRNVETCPLPCQLGPSSGYASIET